MRTILFKGKRNDNGEWVEGDLMQHYIHHEGLTIVCGGCVYYEVEPATVCQYIGRDDKNGKMVFGGDILKRIDRENEEFTVVYDDVYCRFMLVNSIGGEIPINSPHIRSFYEIIGNIHD